MKMTNKKAISPVIATVIIVAVAIAVAIAVAYWVTGIVPAFTRYEELKVINAYIKDGTTAKIQIKNTGSADATIDYVFVNGRLPIDSGTQIFLGSGDNATLTVLSANYDLDNDPTNVDVYKSGVIYDFNIHTSGGGSYAVSARAP